MTYIDNGDEKMRQRKWIYSSLVFLLALTLLLTGCSEEPIIEEKAKPINTMTISEETRPVNLEYFGIVDSSVIKRYSFKSPGRLALNHVDKGDQITKGQLLAELDRTELNFALEAAEQSLVKAQVANNDALDMFGKVQVLYEEGFSSQRDLDLARLDMEVKGASLAQARVDLDYKQSMLNEAYLRADMDGYVLKTLVQEGEITDAGYPVIVVRSSNQLINIGLTQQDLSKIQIGTLATILTDDWETRGEVARIDQFPDRESRTYNAEIILTDVDEINQFYLGSTCRVRLDVGEENGIWIPLTAVLNDGQDYVYTVEDDRALRQYIKINNSRKSQVLIEGLEAGEELIIEGLNKLADGSLIRREGS